tara:strand:+ start:1999 stop:2472 length:474 start_codon:yes stop_codon:yes gene_type:complete
MNKHLKDTGLTYFSHWREAMTYSLVLFIHAWIPNLYPTYVSDKLKKRMACKSCKCGKHSNEKVIEQMDDQTKPFIQEAYSPNTILRHFDKAAPDHLYKWHADDEDRFIESLNENDWQFQFDNELPQSMEPGKIIHIPKGLIHRLIKGTSELSISITS